MHEGWMADYASQIRRVVLLKADIQLPVCHVRQVPKDDMKPLALFA
jgi:hypothetical protein